MTTVVVNEVTRHVIATEAVAVLYRKALMAAGYAHTAASMAMERHTISLRCVRNIFEGTDTTTYHIRNLCGGPDIDTPDINAAIQQALAFAAMDNKLQTRIRERAATNDALRGITLSMGQKVDNAALQALVGRVKK